MIDQPLESVSIKHTILDGTLDWEIQLRTARISSCQKMRFWISIDATLTPLGTGNDVALGLAAALMKGYQLGLEAARAHPQLPLAADVEARIDPNGKYPPPFDADYLNKNLAEDKAEGFRRVGPNPVNSLAPFVYRE